MPPVKSSLSQMAVTSPNNVTKSLLFTAGKTLRSMFLFPQDQVLFVAKHIVHVSYAEVVNAFRGKLSSAENQYDFVDTMTKFQIELMTRFWELRLAICSSFLHYF